MQRSIEAAAPERARLRRLAPPRSLAALLGIVISIGLAWSLVVPPWQTPDELAHFAYVQSIAETFTIPGNPALPGASSEQVIADRAVGASRGAFAPGSAPPDWSRADYEAYLAQARGANRPRVDNGGGPSSATGNPPLYYLYAAIPYLIDHGGTVFGRLYAIRIAGVLLLAITTLGAWLLAGEVFGRRRLPQLVCAAVTALMPMVTFMSTAVNPDSLLITLWTVVLWLGARVINHRAQSRDVIAVAAVTAAAVLTKATSYALVAPVLLAVLCGWLRRPADRRRSGLGALAGAGVVLVVPILAWLALARSLGGVAITTVGSSPAHPFQVREFLSYVWQFYLPRLPFMTPLRATANPGVYDIWLRGGAGNFGWLSVTLPDWMYPAAAALAAAIAVTALALLARLRDRRHLALLAFFGLTVIALLALLHITGYRSLISGTGEFLQGRYLLPIVSLLGLAIGLIVASVPIRVRPAAAALTLTALLAVQAISLATIVQAYYV